MRNKHSDVRTSRRTRHGILTLCLAMLGMPALVFAADITVNVVEKNADGTFTPVTTGFRWTLEEDATNPVGDDAEIGGVANTHALNFHRSYFPVVKTGETAAGASSDTIEVADNTKKYFISVLPYSDYTMSGRQVVFEGTETATTTTVVVSAQPIPTAQIFLKAFEDNAPLNNVWDTGEAGLGGFTVFFYDVAGQALTDVCGNPLNTRYQANDLGDDSVSLCDSPITHRGDGTIKTMTAADAGDPSLNPYGLEPGEVLITNIAPGKYGVRVVPPYGEGWQQTATIEGTPGLDVWVKANEPRYFAEFGPAGWHAEFGFIRPFNSLSGGTTLTGKVVNLRMARPPEYTFANGNGLPGCWIGLNDELGTQALYAGPCSNDPEDGSFSIPNVPDGTYQMVVFDQYLLQIFAMQTVVVGGGASPDLGDVPVFRWYGTQEHIVFMDDDGDGIQDPDEAGIPDAGLTLHYRDGSIYTANVTDIYGSMPFEEIFPFFSWLVAESDYARPLKPTGATFYTDAGGAVGANGVIDPEWDFNPQLQDPLGDPEDGGTGSNCGTDGCLSRTELGLILTEGYNQVIGSYTRMEWGRQPWATNVDLDGNPTTLENENGGIGGIVHYATTRAENDPQFAAWEDWEPGIPRVQVAVYKSTADGAIYHRRADGVVTNNVHAIGGIRHLADVDNYPYCWSDLEFVAAHDGVDGTGVPNDEPALCRAGVGGALITTKGPEDHRDVDNPPYGWATGGAKGEEDDDRNGNGIYNNPGINANFNQGDAIEVARSDSFDDSQPGNCPGNPTDPFHDGDPSNGGPAYSAAAATAFDGKCYDGLRNFNQTRPAVFDGGFGLGMPFSDQHLAPGYYVVEANAPPGYEHVKQEDKNVDFGDEFKVNLLALPPKCVGDDHVVPPELDLFPGVAAESAGATVPLCDRKVVQVSDGKNAALDFFMFTKTPVGGHIQGFVLNDLANEFDPANVNFGEKFAPSYIPVSVRDWAGNEVYHTTTDRFGTYNAIVPSTYSMNIPIATGVSPNMLQVCLNSPMKEDPANPGTFIPEPQFNKQYTQFCYTLNFQPGQTTYLDTPVLPIAAYTGANNYQLDSEFPDGTPRIYSASVEGTGFGGGPLVTAADQVINIVSMGDVQVPDPTDPRLDGGNGRLITRDYGFGDTAGTVTIGGELLTVTSWTNGTITATVPGAVLTNGGGQLSITRSDSGRSTVTGLTVIADASPSVKTVGPGGTHSTIQAAVNDALAGDIVLVSPNVYLESVIVTKPIQLQGWGEGTIINATQTPTDKVANWRKNINALMNCDNQVGLLPGQENNLPGPNAAAPYCGFTPGTGLFLNDEAAGILVAPRNAGINRFDGSKTARIDGFTISGADQSGGIVVNGYADFLEISNNRVENNQSTAGAAGIRIGQPSLLDADGAWTDGDNDFVNVHNNHVNQNGSLFEPGGGIGLYTGSDNYRVTANWISGNFALGDGAGLAHYGHSDNGLIADNVLGFNQTFDQTAGEGGRGGALSIGGHDPLQGGDVTITGGAGSAGSSVKVLRNLMQGNNAGSGPGGGIMLRAVNGAETIGTSQPAFRVDIVGNMIVNNITGHAGGGIALQDAVNVHIINNTVANNDSTATANAAFGASSFSTCTGTVNQSCPQPAGIVSFAHSPSYVDAFAAGFSNPTMTNNIVIGNKAWYWLADGPVGPTGFTTGELLPAADEFQDFGAPLGEQLSIMYSVIAADADVIDVAGNLSVADNDQSNFVHSYRNRGPNTTFLPGGEFPILAGVAADEGGNFIDIHFGPLSLYDVDVSEMLPTTTEIEAWELSDYHLVSSAGAIDVSTDPGHPNGGLDIDRLPRPMASSGTPSLTPFDAGADEYDGTGYAAVACEGTTCNAAPVILTPTDGEVLIAYADSEPFNVRVTAIDANSDPLEFALTTSPGGASIDLHSGLISWQPTGADLGSHTFTVEVTDGHTGSATRTFTVDVIAVGAPTAVDDIYDVTAVGAFTIAAPGVLANDINPSPVELTVGNARHISRAGGQISIDLLSNGAINFTPMSDWVGAVNFPYRASNGALSNIAQVTMNRRVSVNQTQYDPATGTWTISGRGYVGDRIFVNDVEGVPMLANSGEFWAPVENCAGVRGCWTFVSTTGPVATPGYTLTIIAQDCVSACGNPANAVFENAGLLTDVEVNILGALTAIPSSSAAYVQCPLDTDHDGHPADVLPGDPAYEGSINADLNWSYPDSPDPDLRNVVCKHLAAGDGLAVMADGRELYGFSFNDVTSYAASEAIDAGMLNAHFPAPTMVFNQGEEAYVTLTNVGMLKRPDLFDPHTIHFHGFPNAASVFDGVPDASIAINMGFSLTYYYNIEEPGTFMYHCHVEAAEHMQMGMLGNLYVKPAQNGTPFGGYEQFVYNDGDGSTGYDVEYPIQIGSFDSDFHQASFDVQPLPFAEMDDDYSLLNGRGYPDTTSTTAIPPNTAADCDVDDTNAVKRCSVVMNNEESSQVESSLVTAAPGDRVLLRISNLNVTRFNTLSIAGLTMKVVGTGAHILRGPGGVEQYYQTNSVTVGGGEAVDVLVDIPLDAAGRTYVLYSTYLNQLSNGPEDFGGMMTEIRISE